MSYWTSGWYQVKTDVDDRAVHRIHCTCSMQARGMDMTAAPHRWAQNPKVQTLHLDAPP